MMPCMAVQWLYGVQAGGAQSVPTFTHTQLQPPASVYICFHITCTPRGSTYTQIAEYTPTAACKTSTHNSHPLTQHMYTHAIHECAVVQLTGWQYMKTNFYICHIGNAVYSWFSTHFSRNIILVHTQIITNCKNWFACGLQSAVLKQITD
jgi:hypothetical protein